MKPLGLALMLLLTILSASAGEKLKTSVVDLPRPNSGTFSFQQAEARKSEILSNAPTAKLENWKNPFMGFCVHIGKDDSLTVYGHWMKGLPEYSKPRTGQSVADIKRLANELPLEGNPAGVLITSDVPLKDSKAIHELLRVLFVHPFSYSTHETANNRIEPMTSSAMRRVLQPSVSGALLVTAHPPRSA